jgi:hypothetical protein
MLPESFVRRFTQLPGIRTLWRKFPGGSVERRVRFGIWSRPHYAYGVYAAADQAKRLGIPAISVFEFGAFEFGVAGGRGLIALESIAAEIGAALGVEISVFGFDAGEGMPNPEGYRDLPHVWDVGFYKMDADALRSKLKTAKLVLGQVGETIPAFVRAGGFPPIGFIVFDLDYYSSTKRAFALLEGSPETRLPRTYCYFDDIMWPVTACHNEWVGELCAIREFNLEHETQKLAPIHMLQYTLPHAAPWQEQMYVMHDFTHPLYCTNLTEKTESHTQRPL